MAENSKIEWCDHTFNPWVGCTKISPACDNCYAESWAKRSGSPDLWAGNRRQTTPANWRKPVKWNLNELTAKGAGGVLRRPRVFSASLADVFDNEVPEEWRDDLWSLIRETPMLDWLLLTKRIGNAPDMLPADWGDGYPNVWIGATVVTQTEVERDMPKLLMTPARIRFLSCEPLLEHIDLRYGVLGDGESGHYLPGLHWVIVGGESGPNARPLAQAWAENVATQCRDAGVPFFMKQGSQANWPHWKDIDRWPALLQVRQHPDLKRRETR